MPLDFKKVLTMRIPLIIVSVLLASCGGVSKLPSFAPHKIEINQGNLIAPEMRAKLKPGMSRIQVRLLLGTPLINDVFHANRCFPAPRCALPSPLPEGEGQSPEGVGDRVSLREFYVNGASREKTGQEPR